MLTAAMLTGMGSRADQVRREPDASDGRARPRQAHFSCLPALTTMAVRASRPARAEHSPGDHWGAPSPLLHVQLSRRRGARLPSGSLAVTRPGLFGSPWAATDVLSPSEAVVAHRAWLQGAEEQDLPPPDWGGDLTARRAAVLEALPSLRGRCLACWCQPGTPCHADTLAALANNADEAQAMAANPLAMNKCRS
jgi:hypothetical protein